MTKEQLGDLYPLYELFLMDLADLGNKKPNINEYKNKLNEFEMSSNYNYWPEARQIIMNAFKKRISKIESLK